MLPAWKKDTTPIMSRKDPRYIAMVNKRRRIARIQYILKNVVPEAAESISAGIGIIALFAVMTVILAMVG